MKLKTFFYCFVLFFCQSVKLMDIRYEYRSEDHMENYSESNYLKCTYLFSGLKYMLLTQILISPPYNTTTTLMVSGVSYYKNTVEYQIASLHSLRIQNMGSLWLVLLYTGLVTDFAKRSTDIPADYQKLKATHKYVIIKLLKDLRGCHKDISYDIFYAMIHTKPYPPKNVLESMVHTNYNEAMELLTRNNILADSSNKDFVKRLKMINIFFRKADLIHISKAQVSWPNITIVRFNTSYSDAHKLDWSTDNNLQNIKSHYTLSYSFLKAIMFNLSFKHLKYLQHHSKFSNNNEFTQWYNEVKRFGQFLSLTNDEHVKKLLFAINNLSNGTEKIDSVVEYVYSVLVSLCQSLGCEADKTFNIVSKESEASGASSSNADTKSSENTITRVPVEYNSLEKARVWFHKLCQAFKNVNFKLIQLLIEYIDEIKLIASLYSLKLKNMGSLWLLLLYTNLVTGFADRSKDIPSDYQKLEATHRGKVSWPDIAIKRLDKYYFDAHTLDWSTDNLQNIKSHYTLSYSVLKVIMFKLTLNHLKYSHYSEGSMNEWYNEVKQFSEFLSLTNDPHVMKLLSAINNLSNGTEKIDSVVSDVYSILESLCLPLGCEAGELFKIHSKESETSEASSSNADTISLANTITHVPVEYNSLENAKKFFVQLSRTFSYVDFNLIQLLIKYIDEIKLDNDMEE
ncbi:uncharacterized protein LOC126843182 [Adelges cooleyi]|uniref:uncharacterized protein LOC126843182 n=1 Tax=Adelges cooleyi TaxID=133065 RepID=UPI00217FEE31|nr:uncharacterized protein LOC126843182 [Adelges cooleyi]